MDSLPYVDREIDDSFIHRQVEEMIENEMLNQQSDSYNYLLQENGDDSNDSCKFLSQCLKKELLYFSNHSIDEKRSVLSLERYELPQPNTNNYTDIESWKKCIENAHTQLQHQYNRSINIDIAVENSSSLWRIQNRLLNTANSQLECIINKLNDSINNINRNRKQSQEKGYMEIQNLKSIYYSLLKKNIELSNVCESIEDNPLN